LQVVDRSCSLSINRESKPDAQCVFLGPTRNQ
jgi:hypothetical protein